MSYLVLARKWRPRGFEDLIGQAHVVRVLTNAITQGKIAHAYIFSGPRGVGKTSVARILAKALNCKEGPTPSPCLSCPSCTEITDGSSMDVIEIDGASNNSVDNIRDLRERVKYAPSGGRYKVYIIDESHMLSGAAFNALLKTLEEPPPHVVFVLATTEPKKIPLTVMSRCQHLPFRRVSSQGIRARLRHIADSEGITIAEGALAMVARAADGSIRDSLTLLDQVASFSAEISEADVKGLLGASDFKALSDTAGAVVEGDRVRLLQVVSELVDSGTDLKSFTKDLIGFFRDLLVTKLTEHPEAILDAGEEEMAALRHNAEGVSEEHLSLILAELTKVESDVRAAFSPRVALEMSLIRLSYLSTFKSVSEAVAALGGHVAVASAKVPAPAPEKKMDVALPEERPAPAPEPSIVPQDGGALLRAVLEKIEDPRVSAKLSKADPALNGDTLTLTFGSSDAEICAEPIRESAAFIAEIASALRGVGTEIEIKVRRSVARSKKDLKEKAMSEPVVREALDLFEGRVVDVRPIEGIKGA